MRKTAAALITALLITAAAGTLFVRMGKANPYLQGWDSNPPVNTEFSILSPINHTAYSSNLTLNFNVSIVNSTNAFVFITSINYSTSWETGNKTAYKWNYYDEGNLNPYDDDPKIREYSCNQNITNIPEGKQNITITVAASGSYIEGMTRYHFSINESTTVNFTVAESETFPTVPVAAVSAASITAVICAGLLLITKRRKEARQK